MLIVYRKQVRQLGKRGVYRGDDDDNQDQPQSKRQKTTTVPVNKDSMNNKVSNLV